MSELLDRLARRAAATLRALDSPVSAHKTTQAAALEAKGYETWLKTLGSRTFTKPFTYFHRQFWDWYWPARMRLLQGEQLDPDELAMLVMWFRGGGKSSHVEWACIGEGALGGVGYVGYVSDTEAMAKGHIQSIRNRLDSPEISFYYPGLSNPKVDRHGTQIAWRQDYLATQSGWGIIPIGLEEGVRGGRLFDLRFSMFVFDDVDTRKDSAAAVQKKLEMISHEILPAGTADTLKLFPQNLIHENSVLNQIYTRRSDVLSERRESGPVKAFDDLELMQESSVGRKWKIKQATPTWPEIDMRAASVYLADSGRDAFLAEYQHEFDTSRQGRVLQNYRDKIHVIRKSDFRRVFGTDDMLSGFNNYVFHDWSKTKSQYHANVAGIVSVSSQGSPLPGRIFLHDLMSFEANTQPDEVALRLLKAISLRTPSGHSWDDLVKSAVRRSELERFETDTTKLIAARRSLLAGVIAPQVNKAREGKQIIRWRMSHEAKMERDIYRKVYGLPFQATNPGESGGLEWINHYMAVDESQPHPFFPDMMGDTWLFIVVDDARFEYPQSAVPDALHDSDLARFQFTHWRYRAPKLTEAGVIEHGPEKLNDDFGNGLMMLFFDNSVQAPALTEYQRKDLLRPAGIRNADLAKVTDNEEASRIIMSQNYFDWEREKERRRQESDGRFHIPRVHFRR